MKYKGPKNLIGEKFGKLTVIDYCGKSKWKCKCDCGNFSDVLTNKLKSGATKSCGCLRGKKTTNSTRTYGPKIDLTNKQFGYLTALEYIKGGKWKCQCVCGKEIIVDTRNLNSGHTRSCGCLVKKINSKNNTIDMTNYENLGIKVLNRAGSDNQGIALWECECKYCGNHFITRGSTIRNGDTSSCGCIRSVNEKKIIKLLKDNNIIFKTQYTFPDLLGTNNGHLRFDFAIFNNDQTLSHLIEYNGQQHYFEPDGSWGGNNFKALQENDKRKENYCKKHNIPLIIIKYDEKYDINTLLKKPVETIPG